MVATVLTFRPLTMNRLAALSILGVVLVLWMGARFEEPLTPDQMYERALAIEAQGLLQEAGFWFHKAAHHGHPIAQVEVAFMYRYGKSGFIRDPYEVERWLRQAVRQQPLFALADIGYRYEYGRSGVLINPDEANLWFRRAAASCHRASARGDLEAQTMLANLYAAGLGVERDLRRAAQLWQNAAERGYGPAQLNMGRFYWYRGDYWAARPWLLRAAEQKMPAAQYLLSRMYQHGYGVEADVEQARQWLLAASEHGYKPARKQLRSMLALGLL